MREVASQPDDSEEFSYEASEKRWQPLKEAPASVEERVSPGVLTRELNRLAEIVGAEDGRAFRQAVEALGYLNLVTPHGRWVEHWGGAGTGNWQEERFHCAAYSVNDLVRAKFQKLSERQVLAYIVAEEQLPAASFLAAWTRLRDTYYERFPEREKLKRGRRPGA